MNIAVALNRGNVALDECGIYAVYDATFRRWYAVGGVRIVDKGEANIAALDKQDVVCSVVRAVAVGSRMGYFGTTKAVDCCAYASCSTVAAMIVG